MPKPLARPITEEDRAAVEACGLGLSPEVVTLADAIAALCSIGYGGHYDEALPDEEAALDALAHDDDERTAITEGATRLAHAIRDAAEVASRSWLAAQ